MAVNITKCQNGQLFLTNDRVVTDKDGVEFSFENSNALPGYLKHTRKGRVILTGQKIKQPIFGANYLQADITAEPQAGWQGDAVFKIVFTKGGAIEFAEAFQRAVRNAKAGVPRQPQMVQPPFNGQYYPPQQPGPAYNGQAYNGHYGYPPPPQAPYGGYAPPPYQAQAYSPGYNTAPPMPYQTSAIPYPGGSKAAEAYSSGQNVYVPAPQGTVLPSAPPPPYEDKKQQ